MFLCLFNEAKNIEVLVMRYIALFGPVATSRRLLSISYSYLIMQPHRTPQLFLASCDAQ